MTGKTSYAVLWCLGDFSSFEIIPLLKKILIKRKPLLNSISLKQLLDSILVTEQAKRQVNRSKTRLKFAGVKRQTNFSRLKRQAYLAGLLPHLPIYLRAG